MEDPCFKTKGNWCCFGVQKGRVIQGGCPSFGGQWWRRSRSKMVEEKLPQKVSLLQKWGVDGEKIVREMV